ncbi:MAG: helix-turn-helix transcriptional regulator [Dehalococcoidales bacterium]|nr:helix-turn-helix transcriptional regulator [Dehalococcoidales bacterium]
MIEIATSEMHVYSGDGNLRIEVIVAEAVHLLQGERYLFSVPVPLTRQTGVLELTAREKQVLQLHEEGMSNIEVARRLKISKRTVEQHRSNIRRKIVKRLEGGKYLGR